MKAHLLDSDIPLTEREPLTALCGKEIPCPQFVFLWDTDSHDFYESLNTLNTCAKCLDIEPEKRYCYGLIAAQNERNDQ